MTVARAEGRPNEAAKAQHNLGYLEFLAGNLAAALQTMDGVLQLSTDASTAVILLDRARVLIESGLHREADSALREAGELFRAERLFKDLGEVELARAECALLDGQISAARRLAGSARTRFRRRGNDRWRRDAELLLLQSDLAAGRPGLRLAPVALRLAAEYRAESLTTQARTAQLIAAEALLRAGRRDRGRRRPPAKPARYAPATRSRPGCRPAWSGASYMPPMEIRPLRAGKSGPAWMSWPGTRPASAASTSRRPGRYTVGPWASCTSRWPWPTAGPTGCWRRSR